MLHDAVLSQNKAEAVLMLASCTGRYFDDADIIANERGLGRPGARPYDLRLPTALSGAIKELEPTGVPPDQLETAECSGEESRGWGRAISATLRITNKASSAYCDHLRTRDRASAFSDGTFASRGGRGDDLGESCIGTARRVLPWWNRELAFQRS